MFILTSNVSKDSVREKIETEKRYLAKCNFTILFINEKTMKSSILLSVSIFFSITAGVKSSTSAAILPVRNILIEHFNSELTDSQSFCEDISKINELLKGDFSQFKGAYDDDIEGYLSTATILSNDGYYIELNEYNSKSVVWTLDGMTYASILALLKTCDLKEWTVTSNSKEYILSTGPDQAEYILSDAKEVANQGTGTTINLYNTLNKYSNKTEVTFQVYRVN